MQLCTLLSLLACSALLHIAAPAQVPYDVEDDSTGDVIDPATVFDGIKLIDLSPLELHSFLEDEDNLASAQLDILVLKQKKLDELSAKDESEASLGGGRNKRWGSLFRAAGSLFRGSRRVRTTTSGARVTTQYNRPGHFQTALRDFNAFRPSNVRTFNNGRISGQTGQVGPYRITARNGSSGGQPTLEIRSSPNRLNGGTYVRKFRYNNN